LSGKVTTPMVTPRIVAATFAIEVGGGGGAGVHRTVQMIRIVAEASPAATPRKVTSAQGTTTE